MKTERPREVSCMRYASPLPRQWRATAKRSVGVKSEERRRLRLTHAWPQLRTMTDIQGQAAHRQYKLRTSSWVRFRQASPCIVDTHKCEKFSSLLQCEVQWKRVCSLSSFIDRRNGCTKYCLPRSWPEQQRVTNSAVIHGSCAMTRRKKISSALLAQASPHDDNSSD